MKRLQNHYKSIVVGLFMLIPMLVGAQQIDNKFQINKDGKVLISASSSDVKIEYWDKNYVEVTAQINGDYSDKEKEELLKAWNVQTKGDKDVVIVTAGASQWKGERVENFVWRENGKEYEIITPHFTVPPISPLPPAPPIPAMPPVPPIDDSIHINVPKIPELPEMPTWPFSDEADISVKMGDDVMRGTIHGTTIDFDKSAYYKNKKAYLDKLNKKFGTKVTEKQVDQWLKKVDQWMNTIEAEMEEWSKDFETHMEDNFGPEFEAKMEAWGEKFGKEFGEKMEAWGEKYGKDIEKWAKKFEEEFEPQMKELGKHIEENLAPQIEKLVEEITKTIADKDFVIKDSIARFEVRRAELTERLVNRAKEMKERAQERSENAKERAEERREAADQRREEIQVRRINDRNSVWAYRTNTVDSKDKQLIVRVPQNAQVELDVRYGSTELVGAHNIQAHLNYTDLKANTISGDETQIDVSQSDVNIKNWEAGNLSLNFVNDCTIANAKSIALESNTSDVIIGSIEENAWLNGSFGNLKIIQVGSQFKSIELTLENTDAKLSMPNSAYDLYYRGIHSNWKPSSALTVDQTSMGNQEIIKGYHKSSSSKRSVHINARYSDLILQ